MEPSDVLRKCRFLMRAQQFRELTATRASEPHEALSFLRSEVRSICMRAYMCVREYTHVRVRMCADVCVCMHV